MTHDEVEDVAGILSGYESWRKAQVLQFEQSGYHLSVSHYIDHLAQVRNSEALEALTYLFGEEGFDLTTGQIITRARLILGLTTEPHAVEREE